MLQGKGTNKREKDNERTGGRGMGGWERGGGQDDEEGNIKWFIIK